MLGFVNHSHKMLIMKDTLVGTFSSASSRLVAIVTVYGGIRPKGHSDGLMGDFL